jgi:hypothetical protein
MPEVHVEDMLSRRLRALAKQAPKFAAQALNKEAIKAMRVSAQLVPVSPNGGTLRRSRKVHHAKPPELKAMLTYGTEYAIYVHEIPSPPAKSPKGRSARHHPPTQWKYLEQPIQEAAVGFRGRVATDIERRIKKWASRLDKGSKK